MKPSSISPTAADARELARADTGKFGTQDHAESGIVEGPSPERELDEVMVKLAANRDVDLDGYRGYTGPKFVDEVSRVARTIRLNQPGHQYQIVVEIQGAGASPEFIGSTGQPKVGFTIAGSDLVITHQVDWNRLSVNHAATGEYQARAIISALVRHRDEAIADFEKKLTGWTPKTAACITGDGATVDSDGYCSRHGDDYCDPHRQEAEDAGPDKTLCRKAGANTIDSDGFCSEHGWDCGDFNMER